MNNRSAFSLLELIAAMTILVLVIAVTGRILSDTERTWRRGDDQTRIAAEVRAAFCVIESDFSSMVVSQALPSLNVLADAEGISGNGINTNSLSVFESNPDKSGDYDIVFYSAKIPSDPGELRSFRLIHYFTSTNSSGLISLNRTVTETNFTGYASFDESAIKSAVESAGKNPDDHVMLIGNIERMKIGLTYPFRKFNEDGSASGDIDGSYAFFDIAAEIIPERSAKRLDQIHSGERESFINANKTVHSRRFSLRNRGEYGL